MKYPDECISLEHPDGLYLSLMADGDAEAYRDYMNSGSIADPMYGAVEMSAYGAGRVIADAVEKTAAGTAAPYLIRAVEGKRIVGMVALYDHGEDFAELQYSVIKPMRQREIASTAARTLIAHARELWHIRRVGLRITEANTASQAVARKLGAVRTPMWDEIGPPDQTYTVQSWTKYL